MTIIDQYTEHESRVSRFIEQFQNKPDLDALTKSYLAQIQDIEDAIFEVLLERVLDNAVGVQLDALGAIVGQPRTTSDDTEYKVAIQARIRINLSHSTPEDIIAVANLLFLLSGETYCIREEPPAQLRIYVIDPLTLDPAFIHTLLNAADPAAVNLLMDYSTSATSSRLRFSDTVSGGYSTGQKRGVGSLAGFGSTTGPGDHTGGSTVSVVGD